MEKDGVRSSGERFVWEEIARAPAIFRVCGAGSRENGYLVLDGREALLIDPRSAAMYGGMARLAQGLGASRDALQVFLTCPEEADPFGGSLPGDVRVYCPEKPWDGEGRWIQVWDGDIIRIGGYALRCMGMDGTRRRQLGLWLPKTGTLFCGAAAGCDHVPFVGEWDPRIDTLGLQFELIRRLLQMPVRCILPGCGSPAGADSLFAAEYERNACAEEGMGRRQDGKNAAEKTISPECAKVLGGMLSAYCLRILKVYQDAVCSGRAQADKGASPRGDGEGVEEGAALRFLLYRKYIRQRETEDGIFYERGSRRLTDWDLSQQ